MISKVVSEPADSSTLGIKCVSKPGNAGGVTYMHMYMYIRTTYTCG